MRKILHIVFANTVIIFIFGVIWTVLKKDIQGGFGVVACWISVWALSLSYLDVSQD